MADYAFGSIRPTGLWDEMTDAQYLRVYVRQLRQKIESDPERSQFVLTETGIGYRLRAQARWNILGLHRLVSRQRENDHGTKIFEERIGQGRARDEETQDRDAKERPVRQEGQEPQAGDCDRSFRSAICRGEGPEEDRKARKNS